MTLSIQDCTAQKIKFLLKRTDEAGQPLKDRLFEFDIRYYEPIKSGGVVSSGLYVFKTDDKDSHPFNHTITAIKMFQGKLTQQFIVYYKNSKSPNS